MGDIMLGDLKVVHIKQVFRFNRVRYNEVTLYYILVPLPPLLPSPLSLSPHLTERVRDSSELELFRRRNVPLWMSLCIKRLSAMWRETLGWYQLEGEGEEGRGEGEGGEGGKTGGGKEGGGREGARK